VKPRPVLSVADAVTRIIEKCGMPACMNAVGKSSGLIYRWADPADESAPSLAQSIALDQLWLLSGGDGEGPLLSAYRAQLVAGTVTVEQLGDIRDRVMQIGVEFGELSGDVASALADGHVSPADASRLAKDVRDMRKHLDAMEQGLAAVKARRAP